jgi:exopolyphosphatase/guanosine-5'-triphosphate,3'-diphosphate pyrophosphatase
VVNTFSRIVRLGEGLDTSGNLSETAMNRTVEALKVCAGRLARFGVTRARCVSTAACRRADNGSEFLERVFRQTGIRLDVISGEEEARLAIEGCAPLLESDHDHALVLDIGGGSTELIWLDLENPEPHITGWSSLPFGVVTFAEKYGGDNVTEDIYRQMIHAAVVQLNPFEKEHQIRRCIENRSVQMLGTSGTVTTLAAFHQGLKRYDRSKVDGVWIDRNDISTLSAKLAAMTCDERAADPCIGPGRADLVVAGCAILEAINETWPCERLRVADRGVREGVLRMLIREDQN